MKTLSYHIIKASMARNHILFNKPHIAHNNMLLYSESKNITPKLSYEFNKFISNNINSDSSINNYTLKLNYNNYLYNEEIISYEDSTSGFIIDTNLKVNNNRIIYQDISTDLINELDYNGFLNKVRTKIICCDNYIATQSRNTDCFSYESQQQIIYEFIAYHTKIIKQLKKNNNKDIVDFFKNNKNNFNELKTIILKQDNDESLIKQVNLLLDIENIIF